jgi:hypothetical protein
MKLKIEIDMSNAAFEGDNRNLEVGEILRDLAERMEEGSALSGVDKLATLRDTNGNRVGEAKVTR